jgi:acyl-phosphate glycerol 3-phosphate acyltransferase
MNFGIQLLCIALGYAIGAFPTATLVRRGRPVPPDEVATTPDDDDSMTITALWRTTNAQWSDWLITAVDIAKGILAVKVGAMIQGDTFLAPALTGFFATLGHNYNFIFKPQTQVGRGLSIVFGVMLAINPVPIVVFAVCWLTGYFVIRRNVYVGIFTACVATPILMYNAPEALAKTFMLVRCDTISAFTMFVFLLCLQVIVRHFEPIRAMFNESDSEKNEPKDNQGS